MRKIASLLLLLFVPALAHAQATFRSFSAIAASTGADVTVTLPGHTSGDILLLACVVRDQDDSATVSGWTAVTGTPFDRSTVSRYWLFWLRAASSAETNPLFDKSTATGDTFCAVINYNGAEPSGDPWEALGAATTGTADPASVSQVTTATANALVVVAVAGEDDNNASIATDCTDPTSFIEHYVESATGTGGVVTFSEKLRLTAGATGSCSVNWNTANPVGWGGMALSLKRPNPITGFVQIKSCSGTGTFSCGAFAASVTAGHKIIAMIRCDSITCTPTLAGVLGNTFTVRATYADVGSAGLESVRIYEASNITGGAETVTVTTGQAVISEGYLIEYSGLVDNGYDVSAAAHNAGTTHTSGNTGATAFANETIVGGSWCNNVGFGSDAPYVNEVSFSANALILAADKNVTSTGAQAYTGTTIVSRTCTKVVATFASSSQPGGGVVRHKAVVINQ
jgi:hypothetical protein